MPSFDLPNLVDLFTKEVAIVNGLWTIYVAATFAAAGVGFSSKAELPLVARLAITLGFWAFTLGHLHLLRQGLRIAESVGRSMLAIVNAESGGLAGDSAKVLRELAGTANRPWSNTAIHLLIDVCVTVSIWARYLSK